MGGQDDEARGASDKTHGAVLRALNTVAGTVKEIDAKLLRSMFRESL